MFPVTFLVCLSATLYEQNRTENLLTYYMCIHVFMLTFFQQVMHRSVFKISIVLQVFLHKVDVAQAAFSSSQA